jgi:hypothetical protein
MLRGMGKRWPQRWKPTGENLKGNPSRPVSIVTDSSGNLPGEFVFKALNDAAQMGRFDREIRETRRLFGLGLPMVEIVDDYVAGEQGLGHPWYVMRRMMGGDLATRLSPGTVLGGSLSTALDCFEEITRAVGGVHAAGAAHCDLKPGNLLFDQQDRIHLCDLGLCSLLDATAEERETESDFVKGSRHYQPPEAFGRLPTQFSQVALDHFAAGKILHVVHHGKVRPGFQVPIAATKDHPLAPERPGYFDCLAWVVSNLTHADPGRRQQEWNQLPERLKMLRGLLSSKSSSQAETADIARMGAAIAAAEERDGEYQKEVEFKRTIEFAKDLHASGRSVLEKHPKLGVLLATLSAQGFHANLSVSADCALEVVHHREIEAVVHTMFPGPRREIFATTVRTKHSARLNQVPEFHLGLQVFATETDVIVLFVGTQRHGKVTPGLMGSLYMIRHWNTGDSGALAWIERPLSAFVDEWVAYVVEAYHRAHST